MKVVVTGAAGMLASALVPELISAGHTVVQTDIHCRTPEIKKVDIRDADAVYSMIAEEMPDYVFHLAAETNVDLCEKNPDHAFQSNTVGTENVVIACRDFAKPLVYISTGAVFSKKRESAYTEFDIPQPANIYAQSKLQGERIVQDMLSNYFIFRAGWMIGGHELDKKFVYKIMQQIIQGSSELKGVIDKVGSPTFTFDMATHMITILQTKRYGLYHLVNQGACSRYDIAVKIVDLMGYRNTIKVTPVDSSSFPLLAPRPDSEMLRNYKLDLHGINTMPHWKESLKKYVTAALSVNGFV